MRDTFRFVGEAPSTGKLAGHQLALLADLPTKVSKLASRTHRLVVSRPNVPIHTPTKRSLHFQPECFIQRVTFLARNGVACFFVAPRNIHDIQNQTG